MNRVTLLSDTNLFELLRQHAVQHPDAVATASARHRLTTWRKLWSRIERATARLQGEWQVQPGEHVGYCGRGHPDALVLWLALARLGAVMRPIEGGELDGPVLQTALSGVHLVLQDDDLVPDLVPARLSVPLSSLIASHCNWEPDHLPERVSDASLQWPDGSRASIADLVEQVEGPVGSLTWSSDLLFSRARLTQQILPALLNARALYLDGVPTGTSPIASPGIE